MTWTAAHAPDGNPRSSPARTNGGRRSSRPGHRDRPGRVGWSRGRIRRADRGGDSLAGPAAMPADSRRAASPARTLLFCVLRVTGMVTVYGQRRKSETPDRSEPRHARGVAASSAPSAPLIDPAVRPTRPLAACSTPDVAADPAPRALTPNHPRIGAGAWFPDHDRPRRLSRTNAGRRWNVPIPRGSRMRSSAISTIPAGRRPTLDLHGPERRPLRNRPTRRPTAEVVPLRQR